MTTLVAAEEKPLPTVEGLIASQELLHRRLDTSRLEIDYSAKVHVPNDRLVVLEAFYGHHLARGINDGGAAAAKDAFEAERKEHATPNDIRLTIDQGRYLAKSATHEYAWDGENSLVRFLPVEGSNTKESVVHIRSGESSSATPLYHRLYARTPGFLDSDIHLPTKADDISPWVKSWSEAHMQGSTKVERLANGHVVLTAAHKPFTRTFVFDPELGMTLLSAKTRLSSIDDDRAAGVDLIAEFKYSDFVLLEKGIFSPTGLYYPKRIQILSFTTILDLFSEDELSTFRQLVAPSVLEDRRLENYRFDLQASRIEFKESQEAAPDLEIKPGELMYDGTTGKRWRSGEKSSKD